MAGVDLVHAARSRKRCAHLCRSDGFDLEEQNVLGSQRARQAVHACSSGCDSIVLQCVSQFSAGQLSASLNIGPRQPAPHTARLRAVGTVETEQLCGDVYLPGDLSQSESTSTLHPGLSVCMLDPKSPLAAAGIFAAGILVRTNQHYMHRLNSVTDSLKYFQANWLT